MTTVAACRTCGTEPLENARFCHSCGSPVDDGDAHAEYKQVTVLFADVVHSMDIAAAVGAERLREIMADLADRCAAVVQRYGGTVDKFTGDGIMAVFGAPYHCPPETFTDRNTWWAWGIGDDGNWAWNVDPTPLSGDLWGELSLRLIEGMKVLSGFNASTGNVEVRVTDDVTQVLAPETPVTVVATQQTVPQNYGGYIVPGSTLDQAIILVSQFNTFTGDPYNVQQFVVNLNR